MQPMLLRIILILATSILLVLGLLSLSSYFAWFWPLELITHFRVQYLILSLILSITFIILWSKRYLKSKILVLTALLLVGLNSIEVIPWYLPHWQQAASNTNNQIRILSFNIHIQNTRYNDIINSVRDRQPDVALFIEVNRTAVENLKTGLQDILPYSFRSPGGGLAILSRLPIKDARGDNFNGKGNHSLIATLEVNRQLIKFIGIHPLVPLTRRNFHGRNSQLAALSDYIQGVDQPLILVGDFNLTPWSPYYRRLIGETKLHNTRLGFGILPTWPRPTTYANLPSWILPSINIPIDHCLINQHFGVVKIHVGANHNSDHAPLINDLVLRPNANITSTTN